MTVKENILYLNHEWLKEITDTFSDQRRIGEGTYGVVYKGASNEEEFAVKKLYNLTRNDDKQFHLGLDELDKVQHKNIVRLVGYCNEIRHRYAEYKGETVCAEVIERALVLEYCDNGSLRLLLSDDYNGLDWPTRYKIIKGTCDGLEYLHGQNPPFCHLNIKPDNILLDKYMEPKLSDGLSRLFHREVSRNTVLAKTTVAYVSPEYRYDGQISLKCDIYSIGVVMLEIVAGSTGRSKCLEMPRQDFIDLSCLHADYTGTWKLEEQVATNIQGFHT
ncbi:hypothetical protein CFC21_106368 [Triticum aestivum]|uniref:Protein kinase domain-containing protein n=2 Tax=Triticum aestivum TaxID=4565 RepID=A0A3B6T795_WHEAT|nr:hypothetical protein CFC21_106368 [Triticum aestivum]